MICVGYSRKTPSTKRLKQVGIKKQNDRIRKYASEHGLKIDHFYEDKSDDPSSDNGLRKLRSDGLNRRFDMVIFESVCRFGVSIVEARHILLHTFYMLGIHFVVLEDAIDSRNETSESLERYFKSKLGAVTGFNLGQAGFDSLSEEQRPYFNKGRYGYIYDTTNNVMIIDEDAAEAVCYIFDLAAKGYSTNRIAKILNESGIESPYFHMMSLCDFDNLHDWEWRYKVVSRICNDKCYVGGKDEDGAVYPEIISRDVFDRANSAKKTQERAKPDKLIMAVKKKCRFVEEDKKLWVQAYRIDGKEERYLVLDGFKYPLFSFEDINKEIEQAIRHEKKIAQYVTRMINSEEGDLYWLSLENSYKEKTRELFDSSVRVQKDNIPMYMKMKNCLISEEDYLSYRSSMMDEIKVLSDRMSVYTKRYVKDKKLYSENNPWIRRFVDIDESFVLTPEIVRKCVVSIDVGKNGYIKVFLNESGKDVFCVDWLVKEDAYGTKEQKV